jgi:hypothetical protein
VYWKAYSPASARTLPSWAVLASFNSSGTPLLRLTWVRIGFQYWAVSETVRWCST